MAKSIPHFWIGPNEAHMLKPNLTPKQYVLKHRPEAKMFTWPTRRTFYVRWLEPFEYRTGERSTPRAAWAEAAQSLRGADTGKQNV
jgi:hypothetical protein